MFTLQRLNVVKIVDAQEKADALVRQGFTLIVDVGQTEDERVIKEEVVTKNKRGGSKSSS